MIKVRFIAKHKGWRNKPGDEVLLPDKVAQEAIDLEIAIRIDKPKTEHAVSKTAHDAIAQAKNRSLK